MGLSNIFNSYHKKMAQQYFDKFNMGVDSVMDASKQCNVKFILGDYTRLIQHQNKLLQMFFSEIQSIKEPIFLYAHGQKYTSMEAIQFMEYFISELKNHNINNKDL